MQILNYEIGRGLLPPVPTSDDPDRSCKLTFLNVQILSFSMEKCLALDRVK
jgi:hypothetical protein